MRAGRPDRRSGWVTEQRRRVRPSGAFWYVDTCSGTARGWRMPPRRISTAGSYSKPRLGWDAPERGRVSRIVMAWLVRAIYSNTCAATDGPDEPGHDGE